MSFVINPVLPTLTVEVLETLDDLKAVVEDMRVNRQFWAMKFRVGEKFKLRPDALVSTLADERGVEQEKVLVELGGFWVKSSNGMRALVNVPELANGELHEVPQLLFRPAYGAVSR